MTNICGSSRPSLTVVFWLSCLLVGIPPPSARALGDAQTTPSIPPPLMEKDSGEHNEAADCVTEETGHDKQIKCFECYTSDADTCRKTQKTRLCSNVIDKSPLCVVDRETRDGVTKFTKMCSATVHHHETPTRHKWNKLYNKTGPKKDVESFVCDETCCNGNETLFDTKDGSGSLVGDPCMFALVCTSLFLSSNLK